MSAPPRRLRVGISLAVRDARQSIWENGIFQNCAFLAQLFNRSAAVAEAVLVVPGEQPAGAAMMLGHTGLRVIGLEEALATLDVAVEMSALLPPDWTLRFRERGGRVAWMRVGNDYVIDIERAMFDKPPGALCSDKVYDAVWTLPEYEHTCTDYFGITTRAPVRIVPHLWSPLFFEKGIAALPAHLRFGYVPGRRRWRVCLFEPNICMVKTSVIPLLACEAAYREAPGAFEAVRACNTLHLKEHPQFVQFAQALDLVNHGVATFEGRFAFYEFMAAHGDCVVSHHWENGQNYLYYEALYGGYPLVHNSEFIRELGYWYPGFDAEEGGRALLRAFAQHDARLPEERERTCALLQALDPVGDENVDAYTRELLALYGR
jgi:hypothetical protein